MISLEEIKASIKERQIRGYGFNYEQFLNLPKDIQLAIIAKYFEMSGISCSKESDTIKKSKLLEKVLMLKKNK